MSFFQKNAKTILKLKDLHANFFFQILRAIEKNGKKATKTNIGNTWLKKKNASYNFVKKGG